MTIVQKDWTLYVRRLSQLSKKAANDMKAFIARHGYDDIDLLIDYAYALATKYGEGTAALAAEMYDVVAALSKAVGIAPAIPAETATWYEVAKTVQGIANVSQNEDLLGNAVGRLVKQAGADTTLQNALRDSAQFAWIPQGETCAFCIMLASQGWQYASKKAIKGGHAEHIHSNCDCTYAIRFDTRSDVRGYDPQKYRDMYYGAEGNTPKERLNAMRRDFYAKNKEEINEQKRSAYEKRQELNDSAAEETNVG